MNASYKSVLLDSLCCKRSREKIHQMLVTSAGELLLCAILAGKIVLLKTRNNAGGGAARLFCLLALVILALVQASHQLSLVRSAYWARPYVFATSTMLLVVVCYASAGVYTLYDSVWEAVNTMTASLIIMSFTAIVISSLSRRLAYAKVYRISALSVLTGLPVCIAFMLALWAAGIPDTFHSSHHIGNAMATCVGSLIAAILATLSRYTRLSRYPEFVELPEVSLRLGLILPLVKYL